MPNDFESRSGKLKTILWGVIILAVWLGIFAILIKLDVGGFGSSVMKPIFKDVPIIKEILPDTDDMEEISEYPYKSLADAITRIKELELEVQNLNEQADKYLETIADLEAEVNNLIIYGEERDSFYAIREQFYDQVVFGEDAIPYENYKVFYESINPDYAEVLYKQVLQKYFVDERYKELADTYSVMKPKKAAAALYEMTGDLDKVVKILNNMAIAERANILNALSDIDPVFCGKITVKLTPNEQ